VLPHVEDVRAEFFVVGEHLSVSVRVQDDGDCCDLRATFAPQSEYVLEAEVLESRAEELAVVS
jgi:hypothetical protein